MPPEIAAVAVRKVDWALDTYDTVDAFDTFHIVYTTQTALHYLKSSWADGTGVSEIANMDYVVDRAEGADRGDGTDETDVAEIARMNALFYFDCIGHKVKEFKNKAQNGF